MFNFLKISFSAGNAIKASGSIITMNFIRNSNSSSAKPLDIPWETDQKNTSIFNLLRWARRLSDFCGRELEMEKLHKWVNEDQKVSIKFITGDGGTGKTRLGAEFAQEVQNDGWDAGFVNLHRESEYTLTSKKGTLILIDYPEQNPDAVKQLFHSLENFKTDKKLRILFLSRTGYFQWEELLIDTRKSGFVSEEKEIFLNPVDDDSAYQIYTSAAKRACELLEVDWMNIPKEALVAWLHTVSDENTRALFILGAALHDATHPNDEKVHYTVLEIVDALVERELTRLREYSESKGIDNLNLLPAILAMATIAGFAPLEVIKEWVKNEDLNLKLKSDQYIEQIVKETRLVKNDVFTVEEKEKRLNYISALEPDIVASYFVYKVLKMDEEYTPERIWFVIINFDKENTLYRYERIDYDFKGLIYESNKTKTIFTENYIIFERWLKESLNNDYNRCKYLEYNFNNNHINSCFISAAISLFSTLSQHASSESKKALYLGILSNMHENAGNIDQAIEFSESVCRTFSELYKAVPDKYLEYYLTSINNLAATLLNSEKYDEALVFTKEAEKLINENRELEELNFDDNKIVCYRNMAFCYFRKDQIEQAMEYNKKARSIIEKLFITDAFEYGISMAICSDDMSNIYAYLGKNKKAIRVIKQVIEIWRTCVKGFPGRFEHKLGGALVNLADYSTNANDKESALMSLEEAVDIFKKLSINNKSKYEPILETCQNKMSELRRN